ncbi:hypothetical protein IWW50_004383 [Coemansia erecta]|nr:hypothetical protein IWW50_004383 [Coemansia erecta]
MWVGEHWFTICESNVPGCSMVCGSEPDWTTANAGVDCLARAVKDRFSNTEFIVRLSDDMLVDRNYVYDVMRKHQKSGQPLYITSPALDSSQSAKQPVNTRTSGFYMFNRALAKCLSNRNSSSNQTASFEERVVAGCGESAQRLKEDSSKIWLKTYASKNKIIDLAI